MTRKRTRKTLRPSSPPQKPLSTNAAPRERLTGSATAAPPTGGLLLGCSGDHLRSGQTSCAERPPAATTQPAATARRSCALGAPGLDPAERARGRRAPPAIAKGWAAGKGARGRRSPGARPARGGPWGGRGREIDWLRTNGVNTNGVAAKVLKFDRLGNKLCLLSLSGRSRRRRSTPRRAFRRRVASSAELQLEGRLTRGTIYFSRFEGHEDRERLPCP